MYEETFEVLVQLKGKYKLLLLTNGSPDLQKEKLAGVPSLASYFDHIVISGDFSHGKPSESIFEHAMSLLNFTAEEGVMIGDKLATDILGSNLFGMRNMWINRHGMTHENEIVPAMLMAFVFVGFSVWVSVFRLLCVLFFWVFLVECIVSCHIPEASRPIYSSHIYFVGSVWYFIFRRI